MTTAQAVREAKNRWARRRRRLIGYGQWQPFVDAEPVRQHVLAIKATGMGLAGITKHTGVGNGSLEHLLYGTHPYPPAATVRKETAQALLSFWPTLDDYEDGTFIDGTGTRRRMQALAALGWTAKAIHPHIDACNVQTIERLRYRNKVTAKTARMVRDFYDRVSTKPAEEHGVDPLFASRARTWATKYQWAGPEAWDADTIDDPGAQPDWTGYCGTDRGWWAHKNADIPVCPRCKAAHTAWLDEHRDLPVAERFRRMALAKAGAANREANLAHDARELMRISRLDVEQAAARLGVTKNHLHQALKRHPETETELAA